MKKSLLLSISGSILIALTATTLYAQTVSGSSIIDKMKAAARTSFALSADLNPGQTGFDSAPVSGKKTGNMLTAGEWNRMLELISEGGGGSGGTLNITWANFDGSGGVAMKGSNGITSIVRESAGNYRVTFSTPRPNSDYGIICTSGPSPSYLCFPHEKSTTSFLIKTSNPSNNVDAPFVSLIVTPFDVGTSSGGSSPAFYYCTNAQSADANNAPCYGAKQNQGSGNGRYRTLVAHLSVPSYSPSNLSMFPWHDGTKWKCAISGVGHFDCTDGSVLVADTQASGNGSTGSNSPILCSKNANSGKPVGYRGGIDVTFTAADCEGGILPDISVYTGVIQTVQVCGGIETFSVQGLTMKAYSNNLCKYTNGKDYTFDVLYIHK